MQALVFARSVTCDTTIHTPEQRKHRCLNQTSRSDPFTLYIIVAFAFRMPLIHYMYPTRPRHSKFLSRSKGSLEGRCLGDWLRML